MIILPNPAPEGRTETLQLTYIPQMLAVYIQYKYTYKKMYIPDQTYSPTETLQLTYIPEMLAVYIQYQYIYITKFQLSLFIGIGYILPTFGECTSFGGFLCALRAQGWGIFLVRNVHFLICILVLDINCQQVPPGQVPLWTSSPRTTSPRTSSPGRQASKKDNFPPDNVHS